MTSDIYDDETTETETASTAAAVPAESAEPIYLTQLTIENFGKISFARIDPDSGAPLIIGGANEQGKSTVLKAIAALFGGKDLCPAEPIKKGKRKATITGHLGNDNQPIEYVVERRFSSDGGTTMSVKRADGGKIGPAQKFLETLTGKVKESIAFDPTLLTRMDSAAQDKLLRRLTGADVSALEAKRKPIYDQRTLVNKEHERAKLEAERLPYHSAVPGKPVSVNDLVAELEAKQLTIQQNNTAREEYAKAQAEQDNGAQSLNALDLEIIDLENRLVERRASRDALASRLASSAYQNEILSAHLDTLVDPDLEETRIRIRGIQETNERIAANAAKRDANDKADAIGRRAQKLTQEIEEIEVEKVKVLEQAHYPIPGLGFDDVGPTFDGFPLSQASQAQLIRIGVAIAIQLCPRLRLLLCANGNDLDSKSRRLLFQLAKDNGFQVWLEVVSEKDEGCDIIMEDGEARLIAAAE